MRVLVTGAAGFIGSHLVDRLLDRGDEVVGLDNFNDFYSPAIKRRNLDRASAHPKFRLALADIEDSGALDSLFSADRFDAVVHLAARAGVRPSIEKPHLYEKTNGLGTMNLLEALRHRGCPPLVLASSSSVYGNLSKLPFAEDDPVDSPVSPYAATKRANELQARAWRNVHGQRSIALRFFTVYGPRQRPEMAIAKFIRKIEEGAPLPFHGDGSSRRDYTFIDDIVTGTLRALDWIASHDACEILNLGGHRTTDLGELVRLIEIAIGKKAILERLPDQPGDVAATWADVRKAERLLGWSPAVPVSEGIAAQVKWWLKTKQG
jgi:UDP-glucuronate 4-epimerase